MDGFLNWDGETLLDIYQKGIAGGFKDSIVELTIEAYQSLKSGFRLSPIILSGEALHRLNCEIILQYAKCFGSIEYKKNRFLLLGKKVAGDFNAAFDLLDDQSLCSTIYILKSNNIIKEDTFIEMHALRNLRNCAVHKLLLPRIDSHDLNTSLSSEEIRDFIFRLSKGERLPLKYRQFKFKFEIKKGEKQIYIIDQEKLRIEIKNINSKLWISTISLAILLSIFRDVNASLPLKKKED